MPGGAPGTYRHCVSRRAIYYASVASALTSACIFGFAAAAVWSRLAKQLQGQVPPHGDESQVAAALRGEELRGDALLDINARSQWH